jgi:hypothetical protein
MAAPAVAPLPPIDAASVPPACSALAAEPAAQIPQPALEARIALASCGAEVRFNALKLTADAESIAALNAAAKPSMDLLEVVIQHSDPVWSPVARAIRGNLYVAMAVRMRSAIPVVTPQTVGDPLTAHANAHAAVEAEIKPWLDQARQDGIH